MYNPKEVIYGYACKIIPPHNKYLVTIHRDENLHIMACMTTSKPRAGVPLENVHHGAIKRDGEYISYVFEADKPIGKVPGTDNDFAFPRRTTITFDYCLKQGTLDVFNENITDAKVVGVLSDQEYIDLVYAMFKSPMTDRRIKPVLDKILIDFYSNR